MTGAGATTLMLAAAAARLVVEEGLEYGAAKRKAGKVSADRAGWPSNEAVEEAVRAHLALFCADSQPAELLALRQLALRWMIRLEAFRPHLGGAAWRGTATRQSSLHLDLYCDDPKTMEITLINWGVRFTSSSLPGDKQREPTALLSFADRSPALDDWVTLHLAVRGPDDLRGALKPDPHGRSWRGDTHALRHLLGEVAKP